MTWNAGLPYEMPDYPVLIAPLEILYYFDGPQLFVAKFGFIKSIFVKVDESEREFIWLAAPIDNDEVVSLIREKRISVRAAFLTPRSWVVQTGRDMCVQRYWGCAVEELSDDMLPSRGIALGDSSVAVPDSVEQQQAFFAINFQGSKLNSKSISFGLFKNLVDDTYEAARSILSPMFLIGTRSETFDFKIRRPSFGSLTIAVDKPFISLAAAKRGAEKGFDVKTISKQVASQRDMFFSEMGEVVGLAERGTLTSASVSDEHFILMLRIHNLMPSEENYIDRVTFSGNIEESTSVLVISKSVGASINRTFKEASSKSRDEIGVIEIVNSSQSTFVMRSLSTFRQVTCSFIDPEMFGVLMNDPRFKNGARIQAGGTYQRRARRDSLFIDSLPRIIS